MCRKWADGGRTQFRCVCVVGGERDDGNAERRALRTLRADGDDMRATMPPSWSLGTGVSHHTTSTTTIPTMEVASRSPFVCCHPRSRRAHKCTPSPFGNVLHTKQRIHLLMPPACFCVQWGDSSRMGVQIFESAQRTTLYETEERKREKGK